ncbi:T9SS type B sorting domain-containing protein [Flavobacterium sp.]|uniref:T9SS type B sorting domain-containing protein n=1 Tax=Flavobacterium sp. TaxID=239 RepID=UPI00286DE045|nr:T9SS type B sorting domain-containing protein [Flavobacterium sp.]
MKLKNYLLILSIFLASMLEISAQTMVPFTPRLTGGNVKIKGDIVYVGNPILGRTTTAPTFDASGNVTNLPLLTTQANTSYTGTANNNGINFEYIDVDGDASTFSSSTADLNIVSSCKKIIYAGLYWTATYPYDRTRTSGNYQEGNPTSTPRFNDFNQVKFKVPGGAYVDLTADNAADPVGDEDDIIFNGYNFYPGGNPNIGGTNSFKDSPYVCYKNVTNLVTSLADANGTYAIANMRASKGARGNGSCGGWTMVIVYESNNLSSKYISLFDGFAAIDTAFPPVDFNVNGFQTLPNPLPVRATVGAVTLEGDLGLTGDSFRIKSNSVIPFTALSNTLNPVTNFFNSSITNNNVSVLNRNPASTNTLGFDMDIVAVNNPLNAVIPNGETGATLRVTSSGDAYSTHIATFAVEIIEPVVVLTKTVQNSAGVDIGGGNVTLGQELNYVIGFQNIGNDATNSFTIRDILPINIVFNPADLILPPGVTYTYNAVTRELIFTIPNNLVEINDPRYEIRIKVFVVSQCNQLSDACENRIQNQAFATYQGALNTQQITNDPSLSTFSLCNNGAPTPTNFLAGVDDCVFTKTEVLCGANVTLTAAAGYNSYSWSTSPTGIPVIGTGQTLVVTATGTYYSINTAIAPCLTIQEIYTVIPFVGGALTNPALPVADQVVICGNDGKELPYIFLCGANDSQLITTSIAGALSIVWDRLNEASCAASIANCANENPSCTWTQVGIGPNYLVNGPGQYRVTINFAGGCFRVFYFNAYQNLLAPTAVVRDIICTTPGQITVNNVPAGYEYSLSAAGPWQPSNIFPNAAYPVLAAGTYTVYIRQIGVTNGCVFTVPDLSIRTRAFTATAIVSQPLCNGNLGSVVLAANDVQPQYNFSVFQSPSGTLVNTFGPIASNTQTFSNLNPGNYTYTVTSQDGCLGNGAFQIINPPVLTATAAITIPLTCTDGQITVYPLGGTAPYEYIVNGAPSVSDPNIPVPTAGIYCIRVVDNNNCFIDVCITVTNNPPPVYTVSQTNVLCYGNNTGQIVFTMTNANGYTVEYSIDNGVTYSASSTFSNLIAGTYDIIVRYTLSGNVCTTTPVVITITEPAATLTASAGVSQLAGCGPLGEGQVRIINPQGGVSPYSYSFNGGGTYGPANTAFLLPGTYTVYIRDANLCVFPMTVTIDPAPAAPTIVVSPAVFACTGNATSTVTVNNNGGSFAYTYLLDGVPNTPPSNNVFANVPCGPHNVTVNYLATNIPTFSNLLFEDFGLGNDTTSPGINPAYCFERQINNAAFWCRGGPQINDGDYSVTKRILFPFGAWFSFLDHTSNGTNPNGRFLAINIGGVAGVGGILYTKPIADIIPNQAINVSLWAANLLRIDPGNTQSPPDLTIQLVRDLGLPSQSIIASSNTGNIPKSNAWINYNLTLNPGPNTNLSFVIRSNIAVTSGNDVVIDDINVFQIPIACVTTRVFPINIDCNQAFAAQVTGVTNVTCAGANNGTITIAAQNFAPTGFQYSTDGGTTWTTSLTSPVTITGLTNATYNIRIRYDSNPANTACVFPFTQVISAPAALVTSATFTPATCLVGATITATATGGTGPYQYQLSNLVPAIIVPYQNSPIFTNIPPGTYIVTTRDINLCTDPVDTTIIITAPTAPTAVIDVASDFCYDGTNAATLVVTASGGVAPYQYSINAGPFGTNNTFTNLTPSTYTIIVRDDFGCTFTLPAQTINAQLLVSAVLTKDLDCTASPNATITGTVTGGYPPYTVQVSFNTNPFVASPLVISTANAGTYQFQITDNRGCIALSNIITINPIVNPTATTTITNVTCNGLSNGSVTIVPSSGTSGYTISFNGSAFTSTTTYSGLAAGTYPYIVRDSKSCQFTGSVIIGQPTPIVGNTVITTEYSCTTNGLITINASGGTGGYTYFLGTTNLGGNTYVVSASGTYIFTVFDSSGCSVNTAPVVIPSLNPPRDLTFNIVGAGLSCPANTVSVNVNLPPSSGGTPPIRFQILSPPLYATGLQSSGVFPNLPPGTYVFNVVDRNNCSYQETYVIAPIPPLTVNGTLVSNVRCFGTATGAVTFTVGNTTGFTYTLNGTAMGTGTSPINLTGLIANTYTIVVTNTATNCTATATVIVNQPTVALSSTIVVTPISCLANGQVVVNAVGGWGGNVYTLTPPVGPVVTQGSNTFTNISAIGSYTVTTTDSNGCVVSNTFTLTTPVAPTAVIAVASDYCYDTINAATLIVTASGGVAPYQYSINGQPFQNGNTFTNLTPNVYTITVRDDLGCIFILPAQTIEPQLNISVGLTKGLDCTASPNAVISGTVSGGYSPYTYQVNSTGAFIPIVGSTFTFSTPTSGTYQFLITDVRGCTVQSGIVTVAPLSLPLITSLTQGSQILCNGGSTASINVNIDPTVGAGSIIINVLNTTTSVNYGTQTSGLPAGTYLVTITDANSCTDTETIVISQPAPITFGNTVVPITCTATGTALGSVTIHTVAGGVGPYIYTLVSNTVPATQTFGPTSSLSHTFTILNYGIYVLSATDANGCTTTSPSIIISSPPTDLDISITTPPATCAAGGTAVVTVGGALVSSSYSFGIYDLTVPPYASTFFPGSGSPSSYTFTGLIPGVLYTFVVRDDISGCYYFEQAATAIPPLSNLTSTINVVNNVTCAGNADANVTFTFNNYGGTSVTYQIFNSQTNTSVAPPVTLTGLSGAAVNVPNVGPLGPGIYYILFTENNGPFTGCNNASATFTVTQSVVVLSITASVIKNDNCNPLAGQIAAIGQGGAGGYTYQIISNLLPAPIAISPGWNPLNTINADSGNYVAYVKDAFGCITSIPIALPLDPSPVIALAITNQCAGTQGNYSINVTLTTPGVGPYTYSLDGGAFVTQTAPFTYTNLSSGAHTVEIRDFNGCGMTASVTILAPIITLPVITALPTCANNDGVVTLTSTGGTGPFNYTISPNPPSATIVGNVISGLPADTYTITATDGTTLCTRVVTVTLGAATPVTFTTSVNNVICNGDSNGIITVNLPASNNNPIYTYQIILPVPGAVQNSNVFTGLAANTYTIQVNSGRGCSTTGTATITEPSVLVASASATAFTCAANNSVNIAVITVSGVGGTAGFTYSINGINYFTTNTFNIVNNGAIQNFTVYVKDANGCIDTEVISVNPLQQITSGAVTQTTAITCTNPEVVSIAAVGGSGNYNYQLLPSGAVQLSNSFNLPTPGTYFFQVNDLTTGCNFATVGYTVAPFNNINVVANAVTPVTCFGDADGSININVSGYTGTYNYTVFSGVVPVQSGSGNTATNPLVITGLGAGSYTVQVTEAASPFCVITSNVVTVGSPSAPVSLILISNVNANCNIGAQVTVNGAGGTPGYQYAFVQDGFPAPAFPVGYSASNTATLNPSINTQWDVYVSDSRGCFTFIDVTISTDALPTVTLPPFAANQCTSTGNSYTFTATGTGVGTLTYSIGAGFQSSPTFIVTAPGPYTVTIRDGNGCFATASITTYAPINSTPVVTALPTCANNDGVITMTTTGGVGPFTYTIALPVGTIAGNVISNVPAGTYNVTVTDTFTLCTRVVPVTLGVPTPVTFTTTVTPVTCNLGTDGIITVNLPASNDNPIYTYAITAGPQLRPTQNSNVFTGLPAGSYTVLVTSGRACTATQTNIIVGEPAPIVVPAAPITQFGCTPPSNTNNLATIQITGVTGGSGVYTNYQFILGATILQSGTSNTYSTANIAGGTYTINVFDANGCIGTTTAVINPFISISTPTVTVTNPITCTTNEEITIGVTTTGGPAPVYSYTVDGFGANPYLVTQASPVFTGLTIGDYLVTVTNTTTGCSVQTIHYVFDPNTFDLQINNIVDVTCFGGNNGTANITIIDNDSTPTNDAGAFSYTIVDALSVTVASGNNPTAGPLTVTGLPAGIYTANVTLTNNPFCLVSQNFTVNQPTAALVITATSTPITCVPLNDNGTISASATGGWGGPYEFQLMLGATQIVGYSTNPNFTGLVQGNYTVNVRDIRGCIVPINMPLVNPTPIAATVTASAPTVTCFGDTNASITITNVIGGQGSNYTYTLNTSVPTSSSGPITNPVFSGLGAGTYSVTIRDGFNCEFTSGAIIIGQPAVVTADVVLTTAQTCNNQSVLTLTGAGGTPPYSYSLDGVTYLPGTFNPTITINVPVGTHSYYVRDANGCESFKSNDIKVTPLVPLALTLVSSDLIVECFGDANGSITVNATGGLGNYLYTLTGPVNIANQVSGVFNNLPAGNYSVSVTSGDCIVAPLNIIITQPTLALSASTAITNVLCNAGSTGSITVNPAGGTAPYRYAISPILNQFFTTNVFSNLPVGNYTILVQDNNGCFVQLNRNITEPAPLLAGITAIISETCANANDGSFTINNISGGTPPYTISYVVGSVNGTPVTLPLGNTSYTFNNLPGNVAIYQVSVTDANGCGIGFEANIVKGASFTAFPDVNYDCVNNASANSVTINVTSNPAGQVALFSLDGAPDTLNNVFTNLTPGLHSVDVQIDNCIKTVTFTIDAVAPLTVVANNGGLNQIVAVASGGSGNYVNYEFSIGGTVLQSGTSNIYVITQTGTYTIVVTDSNGCTATITKYKVFIPIFIPEVFTPNGDGTNDGWGPTNTENYKNIETIVHDRYGREIATLREGEKWFGKYNGSELPSGDYWYVIRIDGKNSDEYVGHFTLYR